MAAKSPKSSFSRAGIGFNVAVQAACVLFLVVAVIAMAFEHNVLQHLGMHMGSAG